MKKAPVPKTPPKKLPPKKVPPVKPHPTLQQAALQLARNTVNASFLPQESLAKSTEADQQKWISGLGSSYQASLDSALANSKRDSRDILNDAATQQVGVGQDDAVRRAALQKILGLDTGNSAAAKYVNAVQQTAADQSAGQFGQTSGAETSYLNKLGPIQASNQERLQLTARAQRDKSLRDLGLQKAGKQAELYPEFLKNERQWLVDQASTKAALSQLGDRRAQQEFDNTLALKNYDLRSTNTDSLVANRGKTGKGKGHGGIPGAYVNIGIPKQLDKAVIAAKKTAAARMFALADKNKDGTVRLDASGHPVYKKGLHPNGWVMAFEELQKNNLSADQSALAATLFYPNEVSSSASASDVLKMLSNRHVSKAVAKKLLGPRWKEAVNPSTNYLGPIGSVIGRILPGV